MECINLNQTHLKPVRDSATALLKCVNNSDSLENQTYEVFVLTREGEFVDYSDEVYESAILNRKYTMGVHEGFIAHTQNHFVVVWNPKVITYIQKEE